MHVANFDWLYRTNGFENQIYKLVLSEGCSNDDGCQFWGRLEKNCRGSRLSKVFDKTGSTRAFILSQGVKGRGLVSLPIPESLVSLCIWAWPVASPMGDIGPFVVW